MVRHGVSNHNGHRCYGYRELPVSQACAKHFQSHESPPRSGYGYSLFADEETEAQRGQRPCRRLHSLVTLLRSHREGMAKLGFELGFEGLQSP